MSAWLLRLSMLMMCSALASCGVPLQEQPEGFTVSAEASPSAPPTGVSTATVFLVEEMRLVPVERATSEASLPTVLTLLAEGPTDAEAASGLRSALVLGSLDPTTLDRGPKVRGRIVEVSVTESFTRTTGEDQLVATAQLVWTVTEDSRTRLVRVVVRGNPIELPTDTGLTDEPVGRADYRTVAPSAD